MVPYSVPPGDGFPPRDMLDLYKHVPVMCGGTPYEISVNSYRNANYEKQASGGCEESVPLRMCLHQVAPGTVRRAGGDKEWYWVFAGKGSPWAIASVLEDFYIYSEEFIKRWENAYPTEAQKAGKDGKATTMQYQAGRAISKLLKDPSLNWEQTLQKICDGWFGLDCNGFVGNWARLVKPDSKVDPEWKSSLVRDHATKAYRTSLSTIEYWDICAYIDDSTSWSWTSQIPSAGSSSASPPVAGLAAIATTSPTLVAKSSS